MQIRKYADRALEVLMESEARRAPMVRELKFKTFNQEWLEEVELPDDEISAFPNASPNLQHLGEFLDVDDNFLPQEPDATVDNRAAGHAALDDLVYSSGNVELPEVPEDDSSDERVLPEYV
jgi:hypothetical protein